MLVFGLHCGFYELLIERGYKPSN